MNTLVVDTEICGDLCLLMRNSTVSEEYQGISEGCKVYLMVVVIQETNFSVLGL